MTVCSSPAVGWGVRTGRRQTTVSLPRGALACFFSDGLIESRSQGRMLGREGLEALLRRLGGVPSAAALLERIRTLADDAPDDMAACIVAPDAARSASAARIEELELDVGLLAGTHAERFLEACHVTSNEAASAVAEARQIAVESGAAVLQVRVQPAPVQVTVMPGPRAQSGAAESPLNTQRAAPALEGLRA